MTGRKRRLDKQHEEKLQYDLDKFSIGLIKVVGIMAVIIGIAILAAFWYWVMKMLYKLELK